MEKDRGALITRNLKKEKEVSTLPLKIPGENRKTQNHGGETPLAKTCFVKIGCSNAMFKVCKKVLE